MPSSYGSRVEMLNLCPVEPTVCIDLGSGWGGVLRLAAKRYPDARIIGLETSWFPYWFSRCTCRASNIKIYRRSFLHESFPDESVFFSYLCTSSMTQLAHTLPKSGWLISHTFALPNHKPDTVIVRKDMYNTAIYVYRLTKV